MRDMQDWLDAEPSGQRWLRVTREDRVWRVTACVYDAETESPQVVATSTSATLSTALAVVGLEVARG